MADPQAGRSFDAVVFDLDGVITLTASLHAWAWKRTFDEFLGQYGTQTGRILEPFDLETDFQKYVNGRPRIEGVRCFLEARGIALPLGEPGDGASHSSMWGIGMMKQETFLRGLDEQGAEVDQHSVDFVRRLRRSGVATAIASSSKNCERILAKAGLTELFDVRVDGITSEQTGLPGKPAPDIFLEAAGQLGVVPERSVVVEDALSGVEAGRAGGFGLVIGIDRAGDRVDLREHGADLVLDRFAESTDATIDRWFRVSGEPVPSLLHEWDLFIQGIAGRDVVLFLDYDGTLTPIALRPELATLSEEGRDSLRRLAGSFPIAIITGRGREDIEGLVGIPEIVYAGSHGFDIAVPGNGSQTYRPAEWIAPRMGEIHHALAQELSSLSGVLVEDKRFSVAVHYRLADAAEIPRVIGAVEAAASEDARLRTSEGKMVIEVRPNLDWDKGKAVEHLLHILDLDRADTVPLYIGDDVTDEDAFASIAGRGIGILVSEVPRETHARYRVQAPWEVWAILDRLIEVKRVSDA